METNEFRELIAQHQRMVFSIALRIAGEYGAAEEIAQDVFMQLFRSTERPSTPDHTRNYLRLTTVHRATDVLRKQKRQPEVAADEWMDEQHSVADVDGHMSFGVEARLEELLNTLPEAMRVSVVLRYQEDMTPDEIAKLLGQPLATVKSNLQRGLKLMRRKAEVTMKEYMRDGHA